MESERHGEWVEFGAIKGEPPADAPTIFGQPYAMRAPTDRAMNKRLELFELDYREPVGWIDWEGFVHEAEGRHLPRIVFADVPVCLHLSSRAGQGIMIAPMDLANEQTGPRKVAS